MIFLWRLRKISPKLKKRSRISRNKTLEITIKPKAFVSVIRRDTTKTKTFIELAKSYLGKQDILIASTDLSYPVFLRLNMSMLLIGAILHTGTCPVCALRAHKIRSLTNHSDQQITPACNLLAVRGSSNMLQYTCASDSSVVKSISGYCVIALSPLFFLWPCWEPGGCPCISGSGPDLPTPPCITSLQELILSYDVCPQSNTSLCTQYLRDSLLCTDYSGVGHHVGGRLWQTHPRHPFGMFLAMNIWAALLTTITVDNMACRRNGHYFCGGKDCNSILHLPPRRYP